MKVKNDLTSLDDKFRIANKVNAKFLEAGSQKTSILEDLYKVVGVDTEKVLENSFDFKKNGKLNSFRYFQKVKSKTIFVMCVSIYKSSSIRLQIRLMIIH